MQNTIIFFVVKCEPSGVNKLMRPFWNKQSWLKKIIMLQFLKGLKPYRKLVLETVS